MGPCQGTVAQPHHHLHANPAFHNKPNQILGLQSRLFFAFVPCDVKGGNLSWSFVTRFTAFDVVWYRAPLVFRDAASLQGERDLLQPEGRSCPTPPVGGWVSTSAIAYFRFGDMDATGLTTFQRISRTPMHF